MQAFANANSYGGVDGGGGEIGTTPIPEVVRLIKMGAGEFKFGSKLGPYTKLSRVTSDKRLLALIEAPLKQDPLIVEYLADSKIEIRTDGSCIDNEGKEKDAVIVNANPVDPKLCFSARNISRLPKSAVYKEVLALYIHELSHSFGANEVEAHKLQVLALENMDILYTGTINNPFISNRSQMLEGLYLARMFIGFGERSLKSQEEDLLEIAHNFTLAHSGIIEAQRSVVVINSIEKQKALEEINKSLLRASSLVEYSLRLYFEKKLSKEEFIGELEKANTLVQVSNESFQRYFFNKVFY